MASVPSSGRFSASMVPSSSWPATGSHIVHLLDLGLRDYGQVHELQQRAVEAVREKRASETVIYVEHTPTITLGRRAMASHILASAEELAALGIQVHAVERGGDVTYHGPGQLVVYPIIRLHEHGLGASDYMHLLEEVVVRVLSDFSIAASRRQGMIGVWVAHDKVCAMGVRIKRGVTMHGLALNVCPKMSHWETIVPCGITDGGVTSMERLLARPVDIADVKTRMSARLAEALSIDLVPTPCEHALSRLFTVDGRPLA